LDCHLFLGIKTVSISEPFSEIRKTSFIIYSDTAENEKFVDSRTSVKLLTRQDKYEIFHALKLNKIRYQIPVDASLKPEDASLNPEDATLKPEDATLKPEDASLKPEDATLKPEDASLKREDASLKPEDASLKPSRERIFPLFSAVSE
jgi:hypothetical protein